MDHSELAARIATARMAVASAASASGRGAESVTILPITKGFPATSVSAMKEAGFAAVGENRVAEAREKREQLSGLAMRYQMVGHLQRNKVAEALRVFHRIDSVDSLRLARRIDELAGRSDRGPVAVLVQVNASGEETKGGFPVATAKSEIEQICGLEHLDVQGLMTMAPYEAPPDQLHVAFEKTRECLLACRARFSDRVGTELSMGMSNDFEIAIAEGSTQVRLGTVLLGERGQG